MGKAVAIAVNAYPIVQDAMLAVEAASSALADPQDQYAAHLVFGGSGKPSKTGLALSLDIGRTVLAGRPR
ncbi:hypothetical protein [Sphingomonas faeni]|uniref:hypothetical protein n=1 Tax=Sphingomonas faeni TaxID=185950 RepID=UPI0027D8F82B|nr:hypothetical protein [Sphingomonas faeni]